MINWNWAEQSQHLMHPDPLSKNWALSPHFIASLFFPVTEAWTTKVSAFYAKVNMC